ncbi:MAG: hypothetical protein HC786_28435 [Richelia sp. CSU_2_1]|nr:hypothetical protein [Richelia sp. CSU_2_1]
MKSSSFSIEVQMLALTILLQLEGWGGKDPAWISRTPDGRFGNGGASLTSTPP